MIESIPIKEIETAIKKDNLLDTPPSQSNVTDLRGQSPLRAFYDVYTAKNNMLDKIEVCIETEADGTMKKYSDGGEDHYIICVRSGETIIKRWLVPVTTSPRTIEMLMREMLAKAEDAIKETAKQITQDQLKWADRDIKLVELSECSRHGSHKDIVDTITDKMCRDLLNPKLFTK